MSTVLTIIILLSDDAAFQPSTYSHMLIFFYFVCHRHFKIVPTQNVQKDSVCHSLFLVLVTFTEVFRLFPKLCFNNNAVLFMDTPTSVISYIRSYWFRTVCVCVCVCIYIYLYCIYIHAFILNHCKMCFYSQWLHSLSIIYIYSFTWQFSARLWCHENLISHRFLHFLT
jgi:hypothetical protein